VKDSASEKSYNRRQENKKIRKKSALKIIVQRKEVSILLIELKECYKDDIKMLGKYLETFSCLVTFPCCLKVPNKKCHQYLE